MKKTIVIDNAQLTQRLNKLKIDSVEWQFTYDTNNQINGVFIEGNKKDFPTTEVITKTIFEVNAIWGAILRSTNYLIQNASQNTNQLGSKIVNTSPGSISYVQTARASGAVNQLLPVLPFNPISGNVIVAAVATRAGALITVNNITQTGVVWTYQTSQSIAAANLNVEIWLGVVAAGALSDTSVNLTGNAAFAITDIAEFAGILNIAPLDQTANNTNTSNATDTGTTPPTTKATELWIGATANLSNLDGTAEQNAPTNGFTLIDGLGDTFLLSLALEYKIVSAIATANTGTTTQTNNFWNGVIATFKSN